MASSGNWTFNTANKYITGRIRWTQKSNGDLYNSSKVTVYLDYKKSSSSKESTNGGYTGYLYCKGTMDTSAQKYKVSLSSSKFYLKRDGKWVNMASYTFTVKHNGSGGCSCVLGLEEGHCTNGNSLSDPITSRQTVSLDTIKLSAPSITISIDTVKQTSLRVLWTTNTYYNKVEYKIGSGSYVTVNSSTTAKSGNFTLTGLTPGKPYTITIRITRTDATSKLSTKAATTTTVVTSAIETVPNLNFDVGSDESNLTLNLINLDKGNISVGFYIKDDSDSEVFLTSGEYDPTDTTSLSENFPLNDTYFVDLICQNCITRKSTTLLLKTTSGTTDGSNLSFSTTYKGTITIPESYKPIFEDFTCQNTHLKTVELFGTSHRNYIPQGLGRIVVSMSPNEKAVGQGFAEIMSYKMRIYNSNNQPVGDLIDLPYSSSLPVSYDIGTTNYPDTYTVKIYAIDSRGYESDVCTRDFVVLPYAEPIVNLRDLTVTRHNNFEKELILYFTGQYSNLFIGDTNYNANFTINYNAYNITDSIATISDANELNGTVTNITSTSDGDFTTVVYNKNGSYFEDDNGKTIEIDSSQTWRFEFTISDSLSEITRTVIVEQGMPILAVMDNGMVGINMVPDVTDTDVKLQVNGDISSIKEDGTSVKFSELVEIVENLWQRFYPVGSIYMSVKNTNPSTFIGGTWVAWGAGRVPVGVDTSQTEFATVEKKDGSKTHTLTTAQIPAHTHGSKSLTGRFWNYSGQNATYTGTANGICSMTTTDSNAPYPADGATSSGKEDTLVIDATHEHASVGSGQAHNNLQPYITCYMWKRTA